MSKSKQLAKNTLIIGLGRLSSQFLIFLLLPVYTTFLSTSEYGQLDLILIYVAVAAPVLTAQMEMAAFRHLIDARGDKNSVKKIVSSSLAILVLGVTVSAIIFMSIAAVVSLELAVYIGLLFISIAFLNYMLQVTRGLGRNGLFAIASLMTGLTTVGLGIYLVAFNGEGIEGVLTASVTGNTVGLIMLIITLRVWRHVKLSAIETGEVRKLLGYSWPLTLNHLGLWAINGLSRTAVAIIAGTAALGILAAAGKIPLIYTALFSVFAMAWTESAALHIKSEDKDKFFTQVTDATIRLFGSLAICTVAVMSVAFPLLIAPDFGEARQLIPILIFGAFFGSVVAFYGAIYLAVKKTKEVAKITAMAVVLTLAMTLIGVPVFGVVAVAFAIAITYLYLTLVRYRDIKKYVTIQYDAAVVWSLVLVSGVVLYLYYLDDIGFSILSIAVAVLCTVYLNKSSIVSIRKTILNKSRKMNDEKTA